MIEAFNKWKKTEFIINYPQYVDNIGSINEVGEEIAKDYYTKLVLDALYPGRDYKPTLGELEAEAIVNKIYNLSKKDKNVVLTIAYNYVDVMIYKSNTNDIDKRIVWYNFRAREDQFESEVNKKAFDDILDLVG